MRARPSNTHPLVPGICRTLANLSRKGFRLRKERTPMSAYKLTRKLGFFAVPALAAVGALVSTPSVYAQTESGLHGRARIIQTVNEADRVALAGNTHPEARIANDRGPVANAFAMEHMLLQLKRSPAQELAVQKFLDELQSKGSANFHHWVTAQEFGERFGLAKSDLDIIASWLESHGFQVNVVYPSGMLIDFSGTAAQVRKAFQTEIHYLAVKGQRHTATSAIHEFPPRSLRSSPASFLCTTSARTRCTMYARSIRNLLQQIFSVTPLTRLCPQTWRRFTT